MPTTPHHRLSCHTLLDGAFRLRPLRPEDAAPCLAIVTDERVYGPTSWAVRTLADLEPGLSRHVAEGRRWAILRAADGAFVGTGGASRWSDETREAEVAYELAPDVWGKGIATAAVRRFLEEAEGAGIQHVQAHTWVESVASRRVLERAGFVREAHLPHFRSCRGEPRDYWRWRVSLSETSKAGG